MKRRRHAARTAPEGEHNRKRTRSSARKRAQPDQPDGAPSDVGALADGLAEASAGGDADGVEQDVPHFLVAAVGASAGGWPAFSGLLRRIPAQTPLALLLVQHLSADHKSILPELLESVTKMPVETARDQVKLHPGHIYVIAPDSVMTVVDGTLRVTPRTEARLSNGLGPVDALFRSVAEVYRQHAVGLVLSGGGNDGAAGSIRIKEAGGVVMAQSPEEAEIDAMPRAAIAAGAVDATLPVAELGDQLTRLAAHPFFRREASEATPELELPSALGHRRRIFQLLRRATGVDFNHYKPPTLTRRIQRRMALHRISTLVEYVALLERDPRELHQLQADLLIHVTSFFREPDSFVTLAHDVLPNMLRDRGDVPVRVWVPGCSTGEETYSLVMVILECLGDRAENIPLQVFSTDVSESTIEQARAGVYLPSISADVTPERLRRFFTPVGGGYRINKAVRDCCVFARQDVTRDPPFSRLDLIVCRNLLIYLNQPTQRKIMSMFHYALKPDGVLMLGRSETAGPAADLFTIMDKRHQLYVRKAGHTRMEIDFASLPPSERPPVLVDAPPRAARMGAAEWDAQTEANKFLLDRYAPAALLLDGASKIVRSRGNTGRYLEIPTGDVTLDVSKMIRPELLFIVRSLVQEVASSGKAAVRTGVRLTVNREPVLLDLHAIPVGTGDARQTMLLFEESAGRAAPGRRTAAETGRKGPQGSSRSGKRMVADLQIELVETRQQLQGIIDDLGAANEELQSANEEVLSSNEELQSTNEELDTAKEELQSTNEELSTLNDELHGRNEELSRVNSDLVNLLGSVQIPIVMVSQDLRIRRFTPAAEKTLNIIPSDLGRPIGHLKPNFSCPELESLIAHVIDTVTIYDGDVETSDGRKLAMQIRPYKTVENQIDGAVLALFEVPFLRPQQADDLISEVEDAFLGLSPDSVLIIDSQRRVVKANDCFLAKYGLKADEVCGQTLAKVADGQWNVPSLRRLLKAVEEKQGGEPRESEATGPGPGGRPLRFRAQRLARVNQSGGHIVLTAREAGELTAIEAGESETHPSAV